MITNAQELDDRANLTFAPNSEFADRWEAVVEDIINGRHSSQFNSSNLNSEDEDNNTTNNQ